MYCQVEHSLTQCLGPAPDDLTVLSISHSTNLLFGHKASSVTEANFPDTALPALPYTDGRFDLVISDQVLEHVQCPPIDAVAEMMRVLRPGGLLLVTTCFVNPWHPSPSDYWRFTQEGLALLVSDTSSSVSTGKSGNPLIAFFGIRGQSVPAWPKHPLHRLAFHTSPNSPTMVWVLARKMDVPE